MKFSRQSFFYRWLGFFIASPKMFAGWIRGHQVTYRPMVITIETEEEREEFERDPIAFLQRASRVLRKREAEEASPE